MRIFNWLRPDIQRLTPITMIEQEPGIYAIEAFPFVTYVSFRVERDWQEGLRLILSRGYRPVCRDITCLAEIYARPLPLWLFYKTLERLEWAWWKVWGGLFDVGFFNFDSVPEGVKPRWRDYRPGPSAEARSFYRKWCKKMWSGFITKARRFR